MTSRPWAIRPICSVLALLGAFGTAPAHECERIIDDTHDALSFGEGRLGGAPDWQRIDVQARADATCVHYAANRTADCAYVDGDGVWTLVFGEEITRKEIRDLRTYSGKPVLGLSGRVTALDVLREVEKLGASGAQWTVGLDAEGGFATTGLCLRDSHGERWELFFRFNDRNEVTSIGARLEWH